MKRIVLVLVVLAVVTTGAFAQWVVGAELGFNYLLEDWSDYDDVNQVGFPVMLEVGYQLPYETDFGAMGMSTFTVGGKFGFINNIVSFEDSGTGYDYNFKIWTIPVFAYGRAEAGLLYAELGLGLHAWTLDSELESDLFGDRDFGDNGIDVGVYLSGGVNFPLSEQLFLRGGLTFTKLSFDLDAEDESAGNILGVTVGVSYKL